MPALIHARSHNHPMNPLLYLFALVNLVIGTGAFVIAGILKPIADDLRVSIPATGQAMTTYALATALLVPIALVLTAKLSRKHAMQLSLTLFTLGNIVCALANSLPILLAGRVLMGVGAMFTPLAAGLAVTMVAPARRGKALALVFLGVSLAYVIGLPLGAWLGFKYGWHVPIIAIAATSFVALLAITVLVPKGITGPAANFDGLGLVVRSAEIRSTLLVTLLYFIAIFCVFSYIGPVQQALNPMSTEKLSITLAMFGLSGVVGTLLGGWANDRFGALPTLRVQMGVLMASMLVLPFTQGNYALTLAAFIVWGIAGFGMMAPQQSRLATASPANAPLLLSLNTSMLYFGTAAGAALGWAFVGAVAGEGRVTFDRLSWIGLPFAAMAGLLIAFARKDSSHVAK